MFIDPIRFNRPSAPLDMISALRGGSSTPSKIEPGMYAFSHFNGSDMLPGGETAWETYPEIQIGEQWFGAYGVCDSPEQFKRHALGQWLASSDRLFLISFTSIRKADQPSEGGWRWHKWGEYIGEKSPEYEYLHDEGDDIVEVHCFHIYECTDSAMVCRPSAG